MRRKSSQSNISVEKTVRDICRKIRRWHLTEEKSRIVVEGLRVAARMIAGKGIHFDTVVKGRSKGSKLKDYEQFPAWYAELKTGSGTHAS